MRIRGAKTQLEEAGESTEGMAESTASLRAEIMALSGVDIMLDADTFKSTYQIMDELSQKWEGLSDIAQATITELLAGKHQGNTMSSLMENMDVARNALQTSIESSGSAMREHERWSQSLEAKLTKLKSTWQSLSQSFLKSDFLKGTLDVVIALVNGVDKLISTFGTIPTLLTGFFAFKSLSSNMGIFKTFNNELDGFKNKVGIANKTFSELANAFNSGKTGTGLKGFISGLKSVGDSLKPALSKADLSAIDAYNKLIDKGVGGQEAFAKTMQGTSDAAQNLVKGANGAKVATAGLTTATNTSKVALIGAKVAAVAFNAALTLGISFAIQGVISFVSKLVNAKKDLAEKVDEITSKFKEQSDVLKKLKGDYDTSNETSMISKYEKLSKGVDNLGRNVSLTADEYSEYQSIVNKIADQIPSLITGYDAQGNALLNYKGNVEELTEAYEKLIHAQNQSVLSKSGDIQKVFNDIVKENNSTRTGFLGLGGGQVTYSQMKEFKDILNTENTDNALDKLFDKYKGDYNISIEFSKLLESSGFERLDGKYEDNESHIKRAFKENKDIVKRVLESYYSELETDAKEIKTIASAKLSEAFDVSSVISGLNYGNINEDLQAIAYQTVNSLDYDFFNNLTEQGKSVEQWTTDLLNQLNAIGKANGKDIETIFDLRAQLNSGDISYGDYIGKLKEFETVVDGWTLDDNAKNQIKLSLGLEDNGIVDQYDDIIKRLTTGAENSLGLDGTAVKNFIDDLSAEEYSVLTKIVPNLEVGTTIDEIQAMINDKLAIEFKFNIKAETTGIEALNTALAESRSAVGLTSESITALKARYEDLDGFNAAALFEKTAQGIHLNNEELRRLEEQYISTNKLDIDKNLSKLITKYNDLTDEIKNCTDAQKKESLQLEANAYKDKIDELSTLASQYDGLTSAFNRWQTALEGTEEGDNYDSLYENLESMKELRDKGLVGTDKFKTAAQLMSNDDLSTASTAEIVAAFDKGYPKMQRYFTEGQKGCKNFLNDISKLNSEWAHMNEDGSWEVSFNSEEVAKELGVSVDFVLQIAKKLKDYGFEVDLKDTSVKNLQTEIEKTEAKLKELGQSPYEIDYNIEANSANLGKIETEIDKVKSAIQEVNNSSLEPNAKTAQLDDLQAKLEVLIDKKIEASQPAFMTLNTSQVNASLVDALEKVQEYQTALNEVNKLNELKESGIKIDDSQLKQAKEKVDECAKAIQGLDGDVKVAIGLEEDGSIDSIKKAFEEGKVKIDADTDPAINKIEQLAENVQKIEDKDVTINVTVKGLDDVKELNKQINLATDIKGDIDTLSEYVESAKELSKLGDKIDSNVTANVRGNVTETPEYKLNNLKVFGESAEEVKGLGSFTSKVTANVEGNVINTTEDKLDNIKVLSESAKDLEDIGSPTSKVTAEVKGNVTETAEYKLNNLKAFTDNAKDIEKIGDVESKVTANIKGNVTETFEYKINNLKAFSDNAKDLDTIGDVNSKVVADIKGNVIETPEYKINNLKAFSDNAKGLKDIGSVDSEVTANIKGNVTEKFEYKIDNLKTFSDSVKDLGDIGNVESNVVANIDGNVIDKFEYKIDNLKVLTDSAKDLKSIGNISSKVVANVDGDVTETAEYKLNNLKVFSDSAKDIKSIGSPTANVEANITGNVIETSENKLDNLEVFADGVNKLKDAGSFTNNVEANIEGNVIDTPEYKINNLEVFADGAKNLKGIGSIKSEVEANIEGNVVDEFEYKINNLGVFADNAKDLKGIGDVSSNVTANVDGNITETFEYKINNLKTFSDSANDLKSIGTVNSKVVANVEGNVIDTFEHKIDNLKVFTDNAKDINKIGNVKSDVKANVSGNVIDTPEYKINNLKVFADSAKDVKKVSSTTSDVTANVYGNVINTSEDKLDNLGVFATNANKLKNTGSFTSNVTANANGNAITDDSVNTDLEHFASIVSGMTNQSVTVNVSANVDSANINNAIDLLTKVANSGVFKDYKATVQVGAKVATIDDTVVKNYNAPEKDGKVKYAVDENSPVFTWTAPDKDGVVNYDAKVEALTDSQKYKTGTITYKAKVEGKPEVNGTANANGTAYVNGVSGKAYKQGDWGAKRTETALTGELGQELVVYKNRYWTVGDNGAEFATIPKGAIVFNHRQTEELFANGKVTSDGGRGRALVNGTAFESGTAYNNVSASGSFFNTIKDTVKKVANTIKDTVKKVANTIKDTAKKEDNTESNNNPNNPNVSANNSSFYGTDTNSESKNKSDDFEETLDWIETKISRVERAIDNLDRTASSTYETWSERNKALVKEIDKVEDEIDIQQKAYERYLKEANSVGLSESYAKKVRDGTIDIEDFEGESDEKLVEKIKEYQEWYEKALDCKDAIEELKETELKLYEQRFDNIVTEYDGILSQFDYEKSMLDEYISQAEESGHLISKNYYESLIDNEKSNISKLKAERNDLISALNEAEKNGIDKNSQSWVEMNEKINDVTLAIEQGRTALIEYNNAIRQISWDKFDLIQERISDITEEANFLIDLMSNDKLFEDNGQLTNKGLATMGLHAQNSNVAMEQADYYGSEIAKLDKEIANAAKKGDYDQNLINRRNELLELQRESILAAEQEKQAIKDLVSEGIEKELDSLQELIDKKNEALDSERELYEYQKKIEEQSGDVASLRKQIASYSGDNSEESQAKLQELQVSLKEAEEALAESEYDKYMSDQQQMLDDLMLEYSEILNSRLDAENLDGLISDMTAQINGKTDTINATLSGVAEGVGISLSPIMEDIWTKDGKNVVEVYGSVLSGQLTTIETAIKSIKSQVNKEQKASNTEAKDKINTSKTNTSTSKPVTNTDTNTNKTSTEKAVTVGGKINAGSATIYATSSGTGGGRQYYRKDPIYTVLGEKNGYWKTRWHKLKSGVTGWFKKGDVKAYAKGKKNFLENEVAWTQDGGKEMIVRPSDGAILTPIAKGDSVLTSAASNNIWQMANTPSEFIKNNLNLGGANVPNNANVQQTYNQTIENVTFRMDNVKSYEETLHALKDDRRFEKLVNAMTIDRIAGKSSLAKNKSIR